MKKVLRWLTPLFLVLTLLLCTALAEEAPGIHVQLDGQALTFTDAIPQVKDQRTFLPFRAVFEAMGAKVSNEDNVITAVRGDTTLTMTLDQTSATVATSAGTKTIAMDVAPYVDPATWRTYVPVRFAAQAFNCQVGWDQSRSTVIIVDSAKLLDKATANKTYHNLEKLAELGKKFNTGIWDMNASFNADITAMTMPLNVSGTLKSTVQDNQKLDMNMGLKMDLVQLAQLMASKDGFEVDPESMSALDALKSNGMDVTMRTDLLAGNLYVNVDAGDLGKQAGLDANSWYGIDLKSVLADADIDLNSLKDTGYLDSFQGIFSLLDLTDAANDYTILQNGASELASIFADQNFVETAGTRTATYSINEDGVRADFKLALDMSGEAVKAYRFTVNATLDISAEESVSFGVELSMDDQNRMTAAVKADISDILTVDLTMSSTYTKGTKAPVTTPPAGTNILDLTDAQVGDDWTFLPADTTSPQPVVGTDPDWSFLQEGDDWEFLPPDMTGTTQQPDTDWSFLQEDHGWEFLPTN